MGIWIELGVFVLALAFGLWQIQDVKKAQEKTRRQRALESQAEDRAGKGAKTPRQTARPQNEPGKNGAQ